MRDTSSARSIFTGETNSLYISIHLCIAAQCNNSEETVTHPVTGLCYSDMVYHRLLLLRLEP